MRELVRALAKVVLLYAPHMGNTCTAGTAMGAVQAAAVHVSAGSSTVTAGPSAVQQQQGQGQQGGWACSSWGPAWRALLDCLVTAMSQVGHATCVILLLCCACLPAVHSIWQCLRAPLLPRVGRVRCASPPLPVQLSLWSRW